MFVLRPAGAHGLQIDMQSLQMITCGRHHKNLHEPLWFLEWLQMQKLLRQSPEHRVCQSEEVLAFQPVAPLGVQAFYRQGGIYMAPVIGSDRLKLEQDGCRDVFANL